jgi:hypothetical protein
MNAYRIVWVFLFGVACSLACSKVEAQTEVGAVAAMQGQVQLESAGTPRDARVGASIFLGDQVRTEADSRAKVVLLDGSVLDLGAGTAVSVGRQELDVAAARYDTALSMRSGKLRAWVGEPYGTAGTRFEVETSTAVVSVRGAQVVVLHSAALEESEVVNLDGDVEVSSRLGVISGGVPVAPGSFTRIQKGRFPASPEAADEEQLAGYADGLNIIGTGRRDGLNVLHPALMGRLLATKDAPAGVLAEPEREAAATAARPSEFFAQRYSPDVRTNTEPLLEFRQTPPGVPPAPAGSGAAF